MGKRKRRDNYGKDNFDIAAQYYESAEELPEGIHHYRHKSEVPWDILNYFHQRHSIFSLYDEGIWMTDESWYGVTPEPVATKIAHHIASSTPASKSILIDPFAGAGGNVIAFALSGRWQRIYAIEKDAKVLACAKHNAGIYGVEEGLVRWIEGDCFEVLKGEGEGLLVGEMVGEEEGDGHGEAAGWREKSVVFGSPPWGGPGYRSDAVFNLSLMQPYSLPDLIEPFRKITREVALYLPRTSDLTQLAKVVVDDGEQARATVVHYCMEGASKALCVYFGAFDLEDVV